MKKKYFLIIMINTASMTIFCADKPLRGESGGTSVPSAPRGSISGTTQRSYWGSLFQRRPVRKITLRPESTTTEYRDMNADPGIDAYSGMTNAPSILYPTKEAVAAQNEMPYSYWDGPVKKVRTYPEDPGKKTFVFERKRLTRTPTGGSWRPNDIVQKPQPTWKEYFASWKDWWNSR